jgi:hypothetical protein
MIVHDCVSISRWVEYKRKRVVETATCTKPSRSASSVGMSKQFTWLFQIGSGRNMINNCSELTLRITLHRHLNAAKCPGQPSPCEKFVPPVLLTGISKLMAGRN